MVEPFEPDRTAGCSCWHGRSGSPFAQLISDVEAIAGPLRQVLEQVVAPMHALVAEVTATWRGLPEGAATVPPKPLQEAHPVAAACRDLIHEMAARVRQMRDHAATAFAPLRARAAAAERARNIRLAQRSVAAAGARRRERRPPRQLATAAGDGDDDGDSGDGAAGAESRADRVAVAGRCA